MPTLFILTSYLYTFRDINFIFCIKNGVESTLIISGNDQVELTDVCMYMYTCIRMCTYQVILMKRIFLYASYHTLFILI